MDEIKVLRVTSWISGCLKEPQSRNAFLVESLWGACKGLMKVNQVIPCIYKTSVRKSSNNDKCKIWCIMEVVCAE